MANYTPVKGNGRYFVARVYGAVRLVGRAVAGPFASYERAEQISDQFNEIDRKDDSL